MKMRHIFASLLVFIACVLFVPDATLARGGGHSSGGRSYSSHSSSGRSVKSTSVKKSSSTQTVKSTSGHRKNYAAGVTRDKNGRIARSSKAKEQFMKQTGYPHGRPGYVVDHKVPLKRGGKDDPSNMQWQSKQDAKAKDKTE
jgi:hypothetical protein